MGYDINQVYAGSSDHLKSEDIGTTMPTYTMAGVEQKKFDNGDVKLVVLFNETSKSLVLNKTNASAIGDMYGPDTDYWMGKQIMLFAMPVEYQGKTVQGLRVRAPASAPITAPITTPPLPNEPTSANTASGAPVTHQEGAFDPDVPPPTDPNAYGAVRG